MRIFKVFIIFVIVSFLCGCGHIEDVNGEEDYTIESFSEKDLVDSNISHSALGMITSYFQGEGKIKANKFSGIYNLTKFSLSNEGITINLESDCTSGNLRIILIKDGIIVEDFPIDDAKVLNLSNATGEYKLRVIGESAKFSIIYSLKYE